MGNHLQVQKAFSLLLQLFLLVFGLSLLRHGLDFQRELEGPLQALIGLFVHRPVAAGVDIRDVEVVLRELEGSDASLVGLQDR
mmetsp:Transcript_30536/g.29955  ORF Transcript_30536/g.29955 Transcript_30536/m.29955 type:complete len:83 (+) Transcript_30536:540-788(+)